MWRLPAVLEWKEFQTEAEDHMQRAAQGIIGFLAMCVLTVCAALTDYWTCPGSVDTWVMPPGAADATGARRPD